MKTNCLVCKERKVVKFSGTKKYLVSPGLEGAVNLALALEKPLMVEGEPGTGKTMLAYAVAEALGKKLIIWNIKSTTKAKDGLYTYDALQRLYDSRFQDRDVSDISQYIRLGPLGKAFTAEEKVVLLIDEIDKADLEFPNDLLNELDQMYFHIMETGETIQAKHKPIVIITSNREKELPEAFLRRVLYYFIEFPTPEFMKKIVLAHFPDIEKRLLDLTIEKFYWIRGHDGLRKKPSTGELLDWVKALTIGGISPEELERKIPYISALLKNQYDFEYMAERVDIE